MDAVLRIGLGILKYVKAASGLVPNLRVYVILTYSFQTDFTIALHNKAIEEIGIHSRILGRSRVPGGQRATSSLEVKNRQNLQKPQHISTHDTTRVCKSSIY